MLKSFQTVELQAVHRNYGDETPALRDFGVAPSIATALIRWGEQHDLVCTFEDAAGRSNNVYSWKPAFLAAAVRKHIELFGDDGKADIPEKLLAYADQVAVAADTLLTMVRSLALQDLEETSDEEIRSELISEGFDPSDVAAEVAARLSEVIATNHGKR